MDTEAVARHVLARRKARLNHLRLTPHDNIPRWLLDTSLMRLAPLQRRSVVLLDRVGTLTVDNKFTNKLEDAVWRLAHSGPR